LQAEQQRLRNEVDCLKEEKLDINTLKQTMHKYKLKIQKREH
jgi:hypothetical protein